MLEPRSAKGEHLSHLYCIPAEFSWNDLGSWASLYEYQLETRLRGDAEGNVAETGGHIAIEASDNYIFSPRKFVALVGVENLVIVDTEDALLIAAPRPLAGCGQDREGAEHHRPQRADLESPCRLRPLLGAVQFLRNSAWTYRLSGVEKMPETIDWPMRDKGGAVRALPFISSLPSSS